jgi:dATP pyrophosphohydrolase
VTDHSPDCVGVVVFVVRKLVDGWRFLVLRRSGGRFADQWWPIAGTREADEDPVDTAVREIAEETGLTPTALHDTGIAAPVVEATGSLRVFVAFAPAESEVRLNYEHSDFQWLSLDDLVAMVPPPSQASIRGVAERFVESAPPAESRVWP